jgi:hypothetical protein
LNVEVLAVALMVKPAVVTAVMNTVAAAELLEFAKHLGAVP